MTTHDTALPPGSVVVGRDELGPVQEPVCGALSVPMAGGRPASRPPGLVPSGPTTPAPRATQEFDYGWRGKVYHFGAFKPADGAALTAPSAGRTTANDGDVLAQVEVGIAPAVERIDAIMDHLIARRATAVLLFSLAHPRWAFVLQPKYAPYLHLLEP